MAAEEWWRTHLDGLRAALPTLLPTEPDGSADPMKLARRRTFRALLPAEVFHYEVENRGLVRLGWGAPTFSFANASPSDANEEIINDFRDERTLSQDEPMCRAVWMSLDAAGLPRVPLSTAIWRAVELRAYDELAATQSELGAAFDNIGWHDLDLPTPDGSHDPRIGIVVRSGQTTQSVPRRLSAADLVDDMKTAGRTLLVVPDGVASAVGMARLLYVHGWHQWEFLTLAKREAIVALEASLRVLAEDALGRPTLMSFKSLIDKVGTDNSGRCLLSDWEKSQAHRLREARNDLVHVGRGQHLDWISWASSDIELSIRLINLAWARKRASVPTKVSWDS